MEQRKVSLGLLCLLTFFTATTTLTQCEARNSEQSKNSPRPQTFKHHRNLVTKSPRKNDSPLPPPFCINPPLTPLPPSTILPSPTISIQSPPPPPPFYEPSPPSYELSPPEFLPSPPIFVPGPPVYLPPIVYPPPSAPPPPRMTPRLWCVAKPTVPDPILQEALDYACGFGADCVSIQPNGLCFLPNTVIAHASYAFNSYWQLTKVGGGTCDFGGSAMLITVDPSYDDCNFGID